jgi:putative nucleotide binding protein
MGDQHFTLLDVVTKPDAKISVGDKVYIGRGVRDKVDYIKTRISFDQLTNSAQKEVESAVEKIVSEREQEFVNFLNKAGAINIRLHSLELLPSVGKKHLQSLLDARDKKPFSSFQETQERIPHLGDVREIFVDRIMEELRGTSKYFLFVKSPSREEEFR